MYFNPAPGFPFSWGIKIKVCQPGKNNGCRTKKMVPRTYDFSKVANWPTFLKSESKVQIKRLKDYGRPMKPFSLKSRIFGLGQTNWANKLWGIWGIFGNQHPFWYSEFLVHVFHYSIIISTKNTKPLYPHPKYGIGIWNWVPKS